MKRKIISGIYKIISPSGGIYIGQSNDIIRRKWEYASIKCYDQPRLYNSLKKYGWNKHTFEIIHKCSELKLNELEKHYIKEYETFNSEHGMNLTEGGDHFKCSEETKQKISKSRMGIIYGKEIIEKIKATKRNRIYKSRAGNYEIYNQKDELIQKFNGDFRRTLEKLNMPYKSFSKTHKFNRKIKKGNYTGWYAIKL
jgi:group I intron endonuclease